MMPIITPNWMSFLLQVRMAGKNKISMMTLDKRKRVLKMPKGVIVVSASLAAINPPPQMAATRRSVISAASIAVFLCGGIKGILTDAVACTRELLLMGKNVKFPNLAIFSVGLRVLGGAPTPDEFNVSKYVRGVKLRARGTGELTSSSLKLDATIKCVDKLKADGTDGAGGAGGSNGEQTHTGDPAMGGDALG